MVWISAFLCCWLFVVQFALVVRPSPSTYLSEFSVGEVSLQYGTANRTLRTGVTAVLFYALFR